MLRLTASDTEITLVMDLLHVTWVIHLRVGSLGNGGRVGGRKDRRLQIIRCETQVHMCNVIPKVVHRLMEPATE